MLCTLYHCYLRSNRHLYLLKFPEIEPHFGIRMRPDFTILH